MQRLLVDQCGIADLTDLAEEHDTHTVGNKTDDRQVVADKQISQAVLCLNVFEQVEHLALYRYVQRGYRLIADDERRMQRNGSCNSDPLALSAGKLMRITVEEITRHADCIHQLQHPFCQCLFILTNLIRHKRLCNNITHIHTRIEGCIRILEDHLHLPAVRCKFSRLHGRNFHIPVPDIS